MVQKMVIILKTSQKKIQQLLTHLTYMTDILKTCFRETILKPHLMFWNQLIKQV